MPCSGKDSIVDFLVDKFGLVRVRLIDVLQAEVDNETSLASSCREALNNGTLLEDKLMCKLVIKRLSQPDCEFNGWAIDGFPETPEQIQMLMDASKAPKIVCYREFDTQEAAKLLDYYK